MVMLSGRLRRVMPWAGHNAAVLAGQIRTSTGMVQRYIPPRRVASPGMAVSVPPEVAHTLLAELQRLALDGPHLPALGVIAERLGFSTARLVLALDALVAAGRLVLMEGETDRFAGARALRLPLEEGAAGGPVLRNIACPAWWAP
jgi:hypothetical protein